MKKFIYFYFFLIINSCATYTLVEKNKEVRVNSLYGFKSDLMLSEIRSLQGSKIRLFTNNGQGLESFFFSTDVRPGTPLSKVSGKEFKKYRKDMNNIDFVEFISKSLSDFGVFNGKLTNVSEIGTNVGKFQRFHMTFTDKVEGLIYKSIIDRHEDKEILRINGFIAPSKYYFDEYLIHYDYIVGNLVKLKQ